MPSSLIFEQAPKIKTISTASTNASAIDLNSFLNMILFILFRQRDFYRRDVIPYDENRVLLLLPK